MQWFLLQNPLQLFIASLLFSSVSALGSLLLFSEREVSIRSLIATVLFHGPIGGAVGIVAYEYFTLQDTPWTALALAIAYGGGIIKLSELKKLSNRVLRSLVSGDSNDQ